MTTTDPRPVIPFAAPMNPPPAGPDSRTAKNEALPIGDALSGLGTLNGHRHVDAHAGAAVEGQTSPQASRKSTPISGTPAGTTAAPPARVHSTPNDEAPEGRETGQDQAKNGTHRCAVLADHIPGRHRETDAHADHAAGEQTPPAQATADPAPKGDMPGLADPLLALAADILDDLEKARIGNENRLRQLTRDQADTDGIERGFGLDASHPDVARLAALVQLLADAEHQATLNLQRTMRKHPLGAWVKGTKGIGEKQGARLIAAIGDPYWNTLHDRPRTVSELWAYCGYHVIRTPVSDHGPCDTQTRFAADGPDVPADQRTLGTQRATVGGEQNGGHPGQSLVDAHAGNAGVAPKRQRGQKANWSAAAKMRAYLAAESCMKQRESPYRAVYDATRAKYADAIHATECARCGPKNSPAKPGSALSDGHKHARALRAVAKEILRDLWREARDGRTP